MKLITVFGALLTVAVAVPGQIQRKDSNDDEGGKDEEHKKRCKNRESDYGYMKEGCHGEENASKFCSKYLSVTTSTLTKYPYTTTIIGLPTTITSIVTKQTDTTTSSTLTITSIVSKSTTSYATASCTPATPYVLPRALMTAAAVLRRDDGGYGGGEEEKKKGEEYEKEKEKKEKEKYEKEKYEKEHEKEKKEKYPEGWTYEWEWPYPTTKYEPSHISTACSCYTSAPTSTVYSTATITKPGPTSTVTSTTTVTTATSTVLATSTLVSTTTKVVTSTEIKPYSPTGTYVSPVGASFNDYNGIDFQRGDLDGGVFCSCASDKSGSDCAVRGYNYGKCTGFNSCQDICAGINKNASALVCAGVTYNGPEISGACYFKATLEGCGYLNDGRRSGQIELNGYSYASYK